jgi:hypothetical protein
MAVRSTPLDVKYPGGLILALMVLLKSEIPGDNATGRKNTCDIFGNDSGTNENAGK